MDNQKLAGILTLICDYLADLDQQNDAMALELEAVKGACRKMNSTAFDTAFEETKEGLRKHRAVLNESVDLQDIRNEIGGLG
jgi:hypothetical protein